MKMFAMRTLACKSCMYVHVYYIHELYMYHHVYTYCIHT